MDDKEKAVENEPRKGKSLRKEQDKKEREEKARKERLEERKKGKKSNINRVVEPMVNREGSQERGMEDALTPAKESEKDSGGSKRLEDGKKKPRALSYRGIKENVVERGVNYAVKKALDTGGYGAGTMAERVNKLATGEGEVDYAKMSQRSFQGKMVVIAISLLIFLMVWLFIFVAMMIIIFGAAAIIIMSDDMDLTTGGSGNNADSESVNGGSGKIDTMPPELQGKFIFPNVARINSFQGMRFHPSEKVWRAHNGMDVAFDTPGKTGHPIYPIATGVVIKNQWFGTLGNMVGIEHEGGYTSLYGHLQKSHVKVGDRVGLDTPIGIMGATGGNSTGIHLHLEMFTGGAAGYYKKDTRLVVEQMLSCTDTKPMERKLGIHKECDNYQKKVRGIN